MSMLSMHKGKKNQIPKQKLFCLARALLITLHVFLSFFDARIWPICDEDFF